jgi:hypothetical protein
MDNYVAEMVRQRSYTCSSLREMGLEELEAVCMDEDHGVEMKKSEYKALGRALGFKIPDK